MSDVAEGKAKLDVVQVAVLQHASATALVLFPTAWWLGPLRWWVPWMLQGAVAGVGRVCGYRALMERYTGREEWEGHCCGARRLFVVIGRWCCKASLGLVNGAGLLLVNCHGG